MPLKCTMCLFIHTRKKECKYNFFIKATNLMHLPYTLIK